MFMRDSGDSSVWKSLAVAFGDGLAFGVGMKLTQNAQRQALPPASADAGAAPNPLDRRVLEAVTAALDARLNEHIAQVDRRLADMEARISIETGALEQEDRSLATRMEQDFRTLKSQVIALNREFAEQVGRIVAERVAAEVQARTSGLEHSLRAQAMDAADDAVQERLAPIRADVARKDREIAELRKRAAATDSNVFEFILAMGEMCRQAAERLSPPAAPEPEAPASVAPAPAALPPEAAGPVAIAPEAPDPPPVDPGAELRDHFDHPAEPPAPSFSELRKPSGFWRMPMVSSFVVAAAGLAILHFL
jgi:hypothetical protein